MAYKRRTTKTGPNSRSSVTYNTKGPTTFSNSHKASKGVTYTYTSKGGKYYTTRTDRRADGYVERKRISSSSPKKTSRKRSKSSPFLDKLSLVGIIFLILIAIFG